VTAILAALAAVAGEPANVLLLAAAVLSRVIMMLGLGLATAGLTNSPEHAQVTTLPVSLGVIAVASWVGITGTEELTLLKRLLPGGSATELVPNAWNGGVPVTDSLPLLAPTLSWVVVAIALASRLFRWEHVDDQSSESVRLGQRGSHRFPTVRPRSSHSGAGA
jgi:ABC-2 type transport system permease protein